MNQLSCSIVAFLLLMTGVWAQDHSVIFKVKTTIQSKQFPSLVSNKNWDNSKVIDLFSTSNMGLTLESGSKAGWALFVQPNGAWGWNIGDGEHRLDYLPTVAQRINDNEWHEIAISFYLDKETAWLFFDGRHVAIYSLSELNVKAEDIQRKQVFETGKELKIKDLKQGKIKIGDEELQNFYLTDKPDKLTVMAWNIWHGGRHDGVEKGIAQTIEAIRNSGADLVCMQETYGSGPAISDALGTLFYYRSSNLSVHSKFPIVETYNAYQPFRFGGVRVKMGEQLLDVFSLWIHYLPSISKLYPVETVDKILEEENKTRGKEMKEILTSLDDIGIDGTKVPLIIGGDFNSPSHLDWGDDMKAYHHNYVINWPVSASMKEKGFTDSFREMALSPKNNPGLTWSPRFKDGLQQRIDYVYYQGGVSCVNSYVKGYNDTEWPSDHAAVVSEFKFNMITDTDE